jgi:hypothetical protein
LYQNALDVRDNTVTHIAFLTPLVEAYRELQRESALPTTTTERKRAISSEQSQIVIEAAAYSAYPIEQLRNSRQEWSSIAGS